MSTSTVLILCSVDGCGRAVRTRGWCDAHYQRLRRTGSVREYEPVRAMDPSVRFWQLVAINEGGVKQHLGPCIEWLGPRNRQGYGVGKANKKRFRAHRQAWEDAFGPIPAGMFVCHRCDNPPCINVDHLFLGTAGDNNRDAREKGRGPLGEANGQAKLSATQVRDIRKKYSDGGVTQAELARQHGVYFTHINAIILRKRWAWLQ